MLSCAVRFADSAAMVSPSFVTGRTVPLYAGLDGAGTQLHLQNEHEHTSMVCIHEWLGSLRGQQRLQRCWTLLPYTGPCTRRAAALTIAQA
jgi:hypothetical protein